MVKVEPKNMKPIKIDVVSKDPVELQPHGTAMYFPASMEQVEEAVDKIISENPERFKGNDGSDYILTEADKIEIASKVHVEEKTIIERVENPYDDTTIKTELSQKTIKTRIDYDGTNFKHGDKVLNFQELHDIHLNEPDFAFVVYGDRAYLLTYVQDDASAMRELRWESSIATDTVVKTSGIYAKSSDGINIASVTIRDINSETQGNKVSAISVATKTSTSYYPSNKAVVDYVEARLGGIENGSY